MDIENELTHWNAETKLIIQELLDDGSDPDATYNIEHHLYSDNFDRLEKAAVAAFKLGYEVTDAEELELDDGQLILCFDVILESELGAEKIAEDIKAMLELAQKYQLEYDGWGTYFEGEEDNPDSESSVDEEA